MTPRAARIVRAASVALLVAGVVTGLRALPLADAFARIDHAAGGGPVGMAAFGAA